MEHEEQTHKIIGCAYKVFNVLGFGFLESVYKKAMVIELTKAGLKVEEEKPLKVYYECQVVGDFSADLFVEDTVVIELKSVQNMVKLIFNSWFFIFQLKQAVIERENVFGTTPMPTLL
jgi:GxxExxY protein